MDSSVSRFNNWLVIAAVILFILFIILFILYFFMASGTTSIIIISLAILFLILSISLFSYFYYFVISNDNINPPSTPPTSSDNFVRFGDMVQMKNVSNNQFASTCGTLSGSCGGQVSLPSGSGIHSWLVSGGSTGTIITYGSRIRLLSLNIPMAACTNYNIPVAQVTNNFFTGSDFWIILKSSTSNNTTNNLQYNDTINLQNATLRSRDEESPTYLLVCLNNPEFCPRDASGEGCGPLLELSINVESSSSIWSFVKL